MLLRLALLCCLAAGSAFAEDLKLYSVAKRLNPEDWQQSEVGPLRWRGGLSLSTPVPKFGGLSGLLIDPTGRNLTAVTDKGRWVTARLRYDAGGDLVGIEGAKMDRLRGPDGKVLRRKTNHDAEALARLPDGSLLVALEKKHRLLRYPPGASPLAGRPRDLPMTKAMKRLPKNDGMEALVTLSDGRVLALSEDDSGDRHPGFLWNGKSWDSLTYRGRRPYQPSGATLLPGGDILLVERRFSLAGGFAIRLTRIDRDSVAPGAVLESRELARLAPPLTSDNLEGIATRQGPGGETLILLLSDNNFSPLQRNLLLQFELLEK